MIQIPTGLNIKSLFDSIYKPYSEKHTEELTELCYKSYSLDNLPKVKKALENGADPNGFCKGYTPLMICAQAVCDGELAAIEYFKVLVGAGADVNFSPGITAFHCLFWNPETYGGNVNIKVIDALVELGADVNALTHNKSNALHVMIDTMRCGGYRPKTLEHMLKLGIDVNQMNADGLRPAWQLLDLVDRFPNPYTRGMDNQDYIAAVQLLVDYGADIYPRSDREKQLAEKFGAENLLKEIRIPKWIDPDFP